MIMRNIILLIYFTSHLISGKVYHVSPGGLDSNPGSLEYPWQTIQYSVNQLSAGDTLFVHNGVYNESIVINNSGNENDGFIVIKNYK
jgi:hypothetical protein